MGTVTGAGGASARPPSANISSREKAAGSSTISPAYHERGDQSGTIRTDCGEAFTTWIRICAIAPQRTPTVPQPRQRAQRQRVGSRYQLTKGRPTRLDGAGGGGGGDDAADGDLGRRDGTGARRPDCSERRVPAPERTAA